MWRHTGSNRHDGCNQRTEDFVRRLVLCVAVAALSAPAALASAPPVGPLPNGPTTTVKLAVGKSYTARLPQPKVAGRVWRVARPFAGTVVRETGEGDTKTQVWVRFRATGKGSTKVVFAMTRGETSHAYAARTFRFVVG
jgi:predicted secreted protein